MRKTLPFLAVLMAAGGGVQAEASLQQQVDALKSELQYIRDNYERSEPVEIVKPVVEYVSPSGELFTEPQAGGVSPSDGSRLEERVSYRKIKFNRRESVNDKIDAAIGSAMDGRLTVGLELLGQYQNSLGAGDVMDATGQTRSANRGAASGGVDVLLTGRPMRNTLMFVDLDAASGTPALSEAWVSVEGPRRVLSLQAGVVDLTGAFDANSLANDETTQFVTGDFVNSPLLANPANGPGAVLRAAFSRYSLAFGAQSNQGAAADVFDDLYLVAEAGLRFHLLGDAQLRAWGRQLPRGSQQLDQALGFSYDHRLSTRLSAFGRYAKNSYVESYDEATDTRAAINAYDWSASGGLELAYLVPRRLRDKVGLAYGRSDRQDGSSEQAAELYYRSELTPNFSVSLHGQGAFSRLVAQADAATLAAAPEANDALPNAWTTTLRVLASY